MVGTAGFEPATSCAQGRRADQAALCPARKDPGMSVEAGAAFVKGSGAAENLTSRRSPQGTSVVTDHC